MQDKLRIAFVFPRFTGPFGPERSVLSWARELGRLGQDVTVYTHRFDDSCRHLVGPDLKLVETGSVNVSRLWPDAVALSASERQI